MTPRRAIYTRSECVLTAGLSDTTHSPIQYVLLRMRRDYRTLIMEHIQFVHREKRDIHGLLWKTCFYKQIEEYRHSIRGHSNKLNSLYAEQSMGMFKAKEIEFEQAYLNRLTLSFVQYLNDSVVFYQRLLSDVSR